MFPALHFTDPLLKEHMKNGLLSLSLSLIDLVISLGYLQITLGEEAANVIITELVDVKPKK